MKCTDQVTFYSFYCENQHCEEYLKAVKAEVILTEILQTA